MRVRSILAVWRRMRAVLWPRWLAVAIASTTKLGFDLLEFRFLLLCLFLLVVALLLGLGARARVPSSIGIGLALANFAYESIVGRGCIRLVHPRLFGSLLHRRFRRGSHPRKCCTVQLRGYQHAPHLPPRLPDACSCSRSF